MATLNILKLKKAFDDDNKLFFYDSFVCQTETTTLDIIKLLKFPGFSNL